MLITDNNKRLSIIRGACPGCSPKVYTYDLNRLVLAGTFALFPLCYIKFFVWVEMRTRISFLHWTRILDVFRASYMRRIGVCLACTCLFCLLVDIYTRVRRCICFGLHVPKLYWPIHELFLFAIKCLASAAAKTFYPACCCYCLPDLLCSTLCRVDCKGHAHRGLRSPSTDSVTVKNHAIV